MWRRRYSPHRRRGVRIDIHWRVCNCAWRRGNQVLVPPTTRSIRLRFCYAVLALGLSAIVSGALVHADPRSSETPPLDSALETSPDKSSKALPQVTVQSEREALQKRMTGFIDGITHGTRFYGEPLGRWGKPVCFAVSGLPERAGLFALHRLRETAAAAGAPLAKARCRYNLYVVFDADPDSLLQRIYSRHPRAFDQRDGLQAIKQFVTPPHPEPVRVWQNPEYVGADGGPSNPDGSAAGATIAVQGTLVPVTPTHDLSRIGFGASLGFSLVMVVVDMRLVNGYKLGQLVDYCAMAGLADVNMGAAFGDAPTILRLFSAPPEVRPVAVTPWDQSFLHALYHTDQNSRVQRSQIAAQMAHDIAP
jgi:hypothetical protein